jgi:microcystin-dependent protein
MAVNRYYSSNSVDTTLTSGINSAATEIVLASTAGMPQSYPFTLALDYDTSSEELVNVVGVGSVSSSYKIGVVVGTASTSGRGVDGNTATSHSAGAAVKHVISARDIREAQEHINATTKYTVTNGSVTYDVNLHGIATGEGDVVGTAKSQTLTNKTVALGSNTVSGTTAQFNTALSDNDFATLAGSETLTNKILTSPTITGAVISSANIVDGTITGSDIASETVTSSNILNGTIVNADIADNTIVDAKINSTANIAATKIADTAVTLTATQTVSGKTLTSPAINSPVITGGTLNGGAALTVDSTELNYVDGVTSAIQTQFNSNTPVGSMTMYGGITAPTGWLACDGTEKPIATYGALYAVLGINYGVLTDGSGAAGTTHFRVPDLRSRIPMGVGTGRNVANSANLSARSFAGATFSKISDAETQTLIEANLPSHDHTIGWQSDGTNSHDHALPSGSTVTRVAGPSDGGVAGTGTINSGLAGSGTGHNNIQPSTIVNFIIKY